jgi:hypothetical protein
VAAKTAVGCMRCTVRLLTEDERHEVTYKHTQPIDKRCINDDPHGYHKYRDNHL